MKGDRLAKVIAYVSSLLQRTQPWGGRQSKMMRILKNYDVKTEPLITGYRLLKMDLAGSRVTVLAL